MHFLIVGDGRRADELKRKLGAVHSFSVMKKVTAGPGEAAYQAVFDLNFDTDHSGLEFYAGQKGLVVIAGAVKKQLAAAVRSYGKKISCSLAGMNTLPTFINRNIFEISFYNDASRITVGNLLSSLGFLWHEVADRVGMVTPRVVAMIINEAFYTVEEGTAAIEDVDNGMKLGTNYPYGPFEWADRIGVHEIVETLDALYHDTHDERYKVCPMLRTLHLRSGPIHA